MGEQKPLETVRWKFSFEVSVLDRKTLTALRLVVYWSILSMRKLSLVVNDDPHC